MAIKAFTRKPVGTGSSDKFLEKYEELLKRNKGGRLLTGYETSSQNPIYIPGKVINPTGLGETAQQTAQRSANRLPEYGEMPVMDFLDIIKTLDLEKLTPEQMDELSNSIEEYGKDVVAETEAITGEIERPLPNPNFVAPTAPVMGPPTPTGILKRNRTPEERIPREPIGEMMGPPSPETLNFQNYIKTNQSDIDRTANILDKPTRTLEEISAETEYLKDNNPDEYAKRVGGSFGRGLDRMQMEKTGQTPEQLQEEISMKIEPGEGWEETGDGSFRRKQTGMRGEIGDALDVLATYLKLPETGLSEKIAGRPTKNTIQTKAIEPEVQQAGSGLERLRDDMSYSPSAMSGRPDFSSIGLKRSIGNVAGVAGQSAVSPASSPISPSGQTMESVARVNEGGSPVVSNISANPMMQSIGVGTNQPAQVRTQPQSQPQQNNQNNNQQSQPRQSQPQQPSPQQSAPKVNTSYKAPTPISKVFAPSNIGVGSNTPAKVQPVSQPAPKQNVVQTVAKAVSSFLSNLFRRK